MAPRRCLWAIIPLGMLTGVCMVSTFWLISSNDARGKGAGVHMAVQDRFTVNTPSGVTVYQPTARHDVTMTSGVPNDARGKGKGPRQGEWGARAEEWVTGSPYTICQCWPCDKTDIPTGTSCPMYRLAGMGATSPPADQGLVEVRSSPARRVHAWARAESACNSTWGGGSAIGIQGDIAVCGARSGGRGAAGGGGAHQRGSNTAAGAKITPRREALRQCLRKLRGQWLLLAGDSNTRNLFHMLVEEVFGCHIRECSPSTTGGAWCACSRSPVSTEWKDTAWSDLDVVGTGGEMRGVRLSFRFVGHDPAKLALVFSRPQDVYARWRADQVPRYIDPNGKKITYDVAAPEPHLSAPGAAATKAGVGAVEAGAEEAGPGDGMPGFLSYASGLWGIWEHFNPQRIHAPDLEKTGEAGVVFTRGEAEERLERARRGIVSWWAGVWEPTYSGLRSIQSRGGRVAYRNWGPVLDTQQQMTVLHSAMLGATVAANLSAVGIPVLDVLRYGLEAPRRGWPDHYHMPKQVHLRVIDSIMADAC